MSKEKPEVGDVWGIDEYVTRVLFVSENAVRFIYPNFIGQHPVILVWSIEHFVEAYKYLGKSKVSIKELFNVAED